MDRRRRSASTRTYRLWLQRQLQIVVTDTVAAEYLAVLARLGVKDSLIERLARRLDERTTVTHVRPAQCIRVCRDPDDDALLEAAEAGRAGFLVTNDRDLLEIPEADRRVLSFEILTPGEFMARWETGLVRGQHP